MNKLNKAINNRKVLRKFQKFKELYYTINILRNDSLNQEAR